jgi:predicted alpha/beta superfamily hydrolase
MKELDMIVARIFIALWLAVSSMGAAGQPLHITSAVLKEQRQYQVQLPASYAWARERSYPVLYVLDGETHFRHTAASVDFLSRQGEIPEMLVVGLNSTVRIRDFTQTDWPEAWIGGGGAGNFLRFLSTELLPDVERRYRTDGFRVLSGHSVGGQFALYALTAEPSLFRACFAFSPSLDWDHNLPQRSLGKFLSTAKSVPAFLYVARSDDAGRALQDYDEVVDTLKTSKPEGFRWHSQPFPDETHSSVPLLANIDALRALYKGYRFHSDMADKGLPYARQHFAAVSRLVGWELPVPESAINELGYAALSSGKQKDAIELFELNTKNNPNSANAFDSLADGYVEAKDWPHALRAAERAQALAKVQGSQDLKRFEGQIKKIKQRMGAAK